MLGIGMDPVVLDEMKKLGIPIEPLVLGFSPNFSSSESIRVQTGTHPTVFLFTPALRYDFLFLSIPLFCFAPPRLTSAARPPSLQPGTSRSEQ